MTKEEVLINEYGCKDLEDLKKCFLNNNESLKIILDSMELYAQQQVNVTLGSVSNCLDCSKDDMEIICSKCGKTHIKAKNKL